MLDEVFEMFKGSFPLTFLFLVPIIIILSPVNPVKGTHEFSVYRMQHFDLQGAAHGCRQATVNMEARSLESKTPRRCILAKLHELTIERYRDLLSNSAGALLILLPADLNNLSLENKEHLVSLEQQLMREDTNIPVYFARQTPDLLQIYEAVQSLGNGDQATSAAEALKGSVTANGFQMIVNGGQIKALSDHPIINIHGKLSGYGVEEQLPTVAIVAHYDSYGVAPGLAFGADSNASGVVALLELARLFSKLYTNSRTHAKYNLLFLLAGGGKFNYQGTKKWIEDNMENQDTSLLADVSYALCLEALGVSDELYVHVSKPPREGSHGAILLQEFKAIVDDFYPEIEFGIIHKKINLAEDWLAWEHERFSVKRLPGFTLSHFRSHKEPYRGSVLDTRLNVDVDILSRNIKIVAEALARHVYNITSQDNIEIFTNGLSVQSKFISAWLDYLTSQSRAAQLLGKSHPLLSSLEQAMFRYLKDVKVTTVKADKRDPEFIFYDCLESTMLAYNVKPAIFDLFLAIGILAYLGVVYVVIVNFSKVFVLLRQWMNPVKSKLS